MLTIVLLLPALLHCNSSQRKAIISSLQPKFEGYVTLKFDFYEDVDEKGNPVKPIQDKDNIMSGSIRRAFIYDHYLIDLMITNHYNDGKYISTDTAEYILYDLEKQRFASFKTLSSTAQPTKSGSMIDEQSFSNSPTLDPFNNVPDSAYRVIDTIINHKKEKFVRFLSNGTADDRYPQIAGFWIDPDIEKFPLQLSYILSKKTNNALVYKYQLPFPDGRQIMVASSEYQPAKLGDSVIRIYDSWIKKLSDLQQQEQKK